MPDQPTMLCHRTLTASPVVDRGAPVLSLQLLTDGAVPVIELRGDLDIGTSHMLTELVDHVVAAHSPSLLVLDLTGMPFLCAEGITALLQTRQALLAHRAHLILRNPSALARKVLALTRVIDVFDIQHDVTSIAAQHHC
jgi:anti-anti-sigma factor